MFLFNKLQEPVFLKDSSASYAQLKHLKELLPLLSEEGKNVLKQEVRNLEYGIAGEENILFELKNSHMPMYILRDIQLEFEGLEAQIDFLIFTRKMCFVIECKNLYGNIEITNRGEFIRNMSYGKQHKKEGLYSPITQNQRHMDLLRRIRKERQENAFMKKLVDSSFDSAFRSIVVLANPKTCLYDKYAKKEVKEKVIRADQLIAYIKESYKKSREPEVSDKELEKWARRYLVLHVEQDKDYCDKYRIYRQEDAHSGCEPEALKEEAERKLEEQLKAYRLQKSREENVRPYFLFNDKQMMDLIRQMPENTAELQLVAGFGAVKAEKYGDDIIKIILSNKVKSS